MATQDGPNYPFIKDGLVFCWDPKNRDCWSGGTAVADLFGETGQNYNETGTTGTSGALTEEGYFIYDGTNDSTRIDDAKIPSGDSAVSVSVWMLYSTVVQYAPSIAWGTAGTQQAIILNTKSSKFKVSFYNVEFESTSAVSTDTWYNVSFTYAGGTNGAVELFVNGSSVKTGTTTLNIGSHSDGIGFGEFPGSPSYDFNGYIGPAGIYNRQLSSSEVLSNYNRLKSRFGL